MTEQVIDDTAKAPIPDREQLRVKLDAARGQFVELVRSLSDDDWAHASPNPAWNVRQLMYHTAWAVTQFPASVAAVKSGKGRNPPQFLVNPGNMLITKWGARGATRESVIALYERGHAALLETLNGVGDDDWRKGAMNYGTYHTVQDLFEQIADHPLEHAGDVRRAIGRT